MPDEPNDRAGGDCAKVAVAQFSSTRSVDDNLRRIADFARQAKQAGAELVVFPEASTYDWQASAEDIAASTRKDGSRAAGELANIAARESIAIVAGVFAAEGRDVVRNRMLAFSAGGELMSSYDKVHLYDSFGYRESDKVDAAVPDEAGSELSVIGLHPFRIGLQNCYDLRFPEISRALVNAGADTLLVSSAWVAGEHKALHWQTLLKARAIENTCYIIASNQPGPVSVGLSAVIDPFGEVLCECAADSSELATATLSRRHLDHVRRTVPSLQHRKYDITPRPAGRGH